MNSDSFRPKGSNLWTDCKNLSQLITSLNKSVYQIWCKLFHRRQGLLSKCAEISLSHCYGEARSPLRTSAEACLSAQPQGWDKCSVAQHHQASLTVCEVHMLRDPFFVTVCQPTCLQLGQNPLERRASIRAKEGSGPFWEGKYGETLCHDVYSARRYNHCFSNHQYLQHDGRSSSREPPAVEPRA